MCHHHEAKKTENNSRNLLCFVGCKVAEKCASERPNMDTPPTIWFLIWKALEIASFFFLLSLFSLCGRKEKRKQTSEKSRRKKTFQTRFIPTRTRIDLFVCVRSMLEGKKVIRRLKRSNEFRSFPLTNATRNLSPARYDARLNLILEANWFGDFHFAEVSKFASCGQTHQLEFIILLSFENAFYIVFFFSWPKIAPTPRNDYLKLRIDNRLAGFIRVQVQKKCLN